MSTSYISLLLGGFIIIPFIAILIRWRPLQSQSSTQIFLSYIILNLVAWFPSFLLAYNNISNIIVFNIFSVLEFLLITSFFNEIFDSRNKKIYYLVILILTTAIAISVFTLGRNNNYLNYLNFSICILFIILSLFYFIKLLRDQKVDNILDYPIFWLNAGILLYFSCSVFIFIFSNFYLGFSVEARSIWLFHSVINSICYVIFAVGLFKCTRQNKLC